MTGLNWKTIGEVSKEFGIEVPRLRDWCKKGLIEHDMKSNTRYIPEKELEKIEKIRDFFNDSKAKGTRKTFDDVREMLEKENLFEHHLEESQKDKEVKKYEKYLQQAFENMGLEKSLLLLAEKLTELPTKSELNDFMKNIQQQHLLEDMEKKEELKEELRKSNQKNQEMSDMMKQMSDQMNSIQNELRSLKESKEEERQEEVKEEKKGFLSRFFG